MRSSSRRKPGVVHPGPVLALAWVAALTMACSEAPKPPAKLPPVEGNVYRANLFGFSVEKPEDWVFLEETCLVEDTEAPSDDLNLIWERLHLSGVVPLVGIGPRAGASKPSSPVFEVHSVALRPGDRSLVTAGQQVVPPELILGSRSGERAKNPGFEVVEQAERIELAGQPSAVTRLRYRLADAEGREVPVEEFMWILRRGKVTFYLIATAPAPLSPELVETFQRIAHSVRLDP